MKDFDAVEMVRKIRDEQYEQTKDLSKEEYVAYIREKGSKALEQLKQKFRKRQLAA
jgi:hypothetical protein